MQRIPSNGNAEYGTVNGTMNRETEDSRETTNHGQEGQARTPPNSNGTPPNSNRYDNLKRTWKITYKEK